MLTVHHLDYSRSTRVVWLLEELDQPYQIIRYRRPVGGPSPAALRTVHPLGKSPVLDDDGLVIAESSAILRYVDERYGQARFSPQSPRERARHAEWLDYVEGTLAMPLFLPLAHGPELGERLRADLDAQLEVAWRYVEREIAGRDFLMGDRMTLADIQMSYPIAVASASARLGEHQAIEAYLARLMARPALIRAIQAGGPMVPDFA